MTTVDVPIFKDRPDLSTPVDAAHMRAWGDAIKANADAAEAAAAGASIDGGNATSVYTDTFNLDGGSAAA